MPPGPGKRAEAKAKAAQEAQAAVDAAEAAAAEKEAAKKAAEAPPPAPAAEAPAEAPAPAPVKEDVEMTDAPPAAAALPLGVVSRRFSIRSPRGAASAPVLRGSASLQKPGCYGLSTSSMGLCRHALGAPSDGRRDRIPLKPPQTIKLYAADARTRKLGN